VRTKLWGAVQRTPSLVRFPDGDGYPGESFAEVQGRAVDALGRIARAHGRRIVAVVSHADVIRLVLAHYSGVHLDLFQRVIVSPGSVSAVALHGGPAAILRVNDTGTFSDLVPARPPGGRSRGRVRG
jgi:broad specificity phosphatase PhoE